MVLHYHQREKRALIGCTCAGLTAIKSEAIKTPRSLPVAFPWVEDSGYHKVHVNGRHSNGNANARDLARTQLRHSRDVVRSGLLDRGAARGVKC